MPKLLNLNANNNSLPNKPGLTEEEQYIIDLFLRQPFHSLSSFNAMLTKVPFTNTAVDTMAATERVEAAFNSLESKGVISCLGDRRSPHATWVLRHEDSEVNHDTR